MAPLAVDWKLDQPQTTITIGNGEVNALQWPGHSPGSVVYYTELDGQRVLFGQDVRGLIHPTLMSDETAYQSSLQNLLDLDADRLLEGHFGILRGKKEIRRFINSYRHP